MSRDTLRIPAMAHIALSNGRRFDYNDESTWSNLTIEAIATALARIPRYLGHTIVPYTVAEHALRVSYLVAPEFALQALLHDAAEAVLGDMPAPLKMLPGFEAFRDLEDRILAHVLQRYGFPGTLPPEVHEADYQAFRDEVAVLAVNQTIEMWGFTPALYREPLVPITRLDPVQAKLWFTDRYYTLLALRRGQ